MARKKQPHPPAPAREKPFSTTPFAALKGVVVETAKPGAVEPVKQTAPSEPKRSEDDLFLQAMAGVQRIEPQPTGTRKKPQTGAALPHQQPQPRRKALPRDEVTARKDFLLAVEKLQLDVRFSDSLPDDELRPLNGNRLRQLKRGIIQLNRQLDLHGLTREEALAALAPFLTAARTAGEKGVLVITGKGTHSTDGPVLQQTVAGWLRDQGRELVAEYAPAPTELGGSGAFVIFLRPLDKQTSD